LKIILVLIATVFLFGCGGDDKEKNSYFSKWTNIDNSDVTLDLSAGELTSLMFIQIALKTGPICNCSVVATGTKTKGAYEVGDCEGAVSESAECTSFSASGAFEVEGGNMEMCGNSSVDQEINCSYWE